VVAEAFVCVAAQNVWLGVSCERQKEAAERIRLLEQIAGHSAVREPRTHCSPESICRDAVRTIRALALFTFGRHAFRE